MKRIPAPTLVCSSGSSQSGERGDRYSASKDTESFFQGWMPPSSLFMVHEELKKMLDLAEELGLPTSFEGYLFTASFSGPHIKMCLNVSLPRG